MYCAYVCCIHIICSAVYSGDMKPWPYVMLLVEPGIIAGIVPGMAAYISGFSGEYWWADDITELQQQQHCTICSNRITLVVQYMTVTLITNWDGRSTHLEGSVLSLYHVKFTTMLNYFFIVWDWILTEARSILRDAYHIQSMKNATWNSKFSRLKIYWCPCCCAVILKQWG